MNSIAETRGVTAREWTERLVLQERELREENQRHVYRETEQARASIDLRLDAMNELRAQITNERGNYLARDSFDRLHNALEERIRLIETFKANMDGRFLMLGGIMVLAQLVIGIVGLVWLRAK